MVKRRSPELAAEARRLNREQLARLGAEVRASRHRRRLTQQQLARRAGIARSTLGDLERGLGGGHTVDAWQRIALALDRPLRLDLGRDRLEDPADAGHLAIQELVLRLARAAGRRGWFELPSKPSDPSRHTDVGIRDDNRQTLLLVECWNSLGDIGAAARATSRKAAEAADLAVAVGGEQPYRVATCWVVRASVRNRALVARYPEVFNARLPGSSVRWVRALSEGQDAPAEPGLVWCDVGATRLFAWRR